MSIKSEKLKAAKSGRLIVATSQESAAFTLGVDVRTLQRWSSRGCPGERGRYVIRDLIAWARENVWSEDGVSLDCVSADTQETYLLAKIEKLKRDTTLADFKIAERNENLVDAGEVKALLAHHAAYIRAGLEKLERRFGKDALDLVLELFDELDAIDLKAGVSP